VGHQAYRAAIPDHVPTVRKWLRRFQQQRPRGLLELSRAPHHQPGKTPADIEQQVVALRQQVPTFGARRLIREFDLPLSHRALERIWRAHGLLRKRRRKYQRKQNLAHIKARPGVEGRDLAEYLVELVGLELLADTDNT